MILCTVFQLFIAVCFFILQGMLERKKILDTLQESKASTICPDIEEDLVAWTFKNRWQHNQTNILQNLDCAYEKEEKKKKVKRKKSWIMQKTTKEKWRFDGKVSSLQLKKNKHCHTPWEYFPQGLISWIFSPILFYYKTVGCLL